LWPAIKKATGVGGAEKKKNLIRSSGPPCPEPGRAALGDANRGGGPIGTGPKGRPPQAAARIAKGGGGKKGPAPRSKKGKEKKKNRRRQRGFSAVSQVSLPPRQHSPGGGPRGKQCCWVRWGGGGRGKKGENLPRRFWWPGQTVLGRKGGGGPPRRRGGLGAPRGFDGLGERWRGPAAVFEGGGRNMWAGIGGGLGAAQKGAVGPSKGARGKIGTNTSRGGRGGGRRTKKGGARPPRILGGGRLWKGGGADAAGMGWAGSTNRGLGGQRALKRPGGRVQAG